VAEAEQSSEQSVAAARPGAPDVSAESMAAFVPLALPPSAPLPDIRIELRRGVTAVKMTWPGTAASECAVWLRELLR